MSVKNHRVNVSLKGRTGIVLGVMIDVDVYGRSGEHEACDKAEDFANRDPEHSTNGPWTALATRFEF